MTGGGDIVGKRGFLQQNRHCIMLSLPEQSSLKKAFLSKRNLSLRKSLFYLCARLSLVKMELEAEGDFFRSWGIGMFIMWLQILSLYMFVVPRK